MYDQEEAEGKRAWELVLREQIQIEWECPQLARHRGPEGHGC